MQLALSILNPSILALESLAMTMPHALQKGTVTNAVVMKGMQIRITQQILPVGFGSDNESKTT